MVGPTPDIEVDGPPDTESVLRCCSPHTPDSQDRIHVLRKFFECHLEGMTEKQMYNVCFCLVEYPRGTKKHLEPTLVRPLFAPQ